VTVRKRFHDHGAHQRIDLRPVEGAERRDGLQELIKIFQGLFADAEESAKPE
jgi:hypothetical protein